MPIAGVALVPMFFGLPMLLHPIHIVFLEMIIDPACSVVFEAEPADPDNMRRPPRAPGRLFDRRTLLRCVAQGLCALAACLAVLFYSLHWRAQPVEVAQSATFATLVLANVGLILVHRARGVSLLRSLRTPNKALWAVLIGTLVLLALTLEVPPLQRIFHFTSVPWLQLLLGALLGPLSVLGWALWPARALSDLASQQLDCPSNAATAPCLTDTDMTAIFSAATATCGLAEAAACTIPLRRCNIGSCRRRPDRRARSRSSSAL